MLHSTGIKYYIISENCEKLRRGYYTCGPSILLIWGCPLATCILFIRGLRFAAGVWLTRCLPFATGVWLTWCLSFATGTWFINGLPLVVQLWSFSQDVEHKSKEGDTDGILNYLLH